MTKDNKNKQFTELSEEDLKNVNGGLSTGCEVGGSSKIRVRGAGTLTSSTDPLYIVDGVAADEKLTAGFGGGIEPDKIETMALMKD